MTLQAYVDLVESNVGSVCLSDADGRGLRQLGQK